jgi:hypothetical protein
MVAPGGFGDDRVPICLGLRHDHKHLAPLRIFSFMPCASSTLTITLIHTVTIGELIVGLGTLALASLTGVLAFQTKKSARATQAVLASAEEPFVITTPTDRLERMRLREHERPESGTIPPFEIHRAYDKMGHFVRLKLWNIGHGPAIVHQVRLCRDDVDYLDSLPKMYPLGVGHSVDIEIRSQRWPSSSSAATLLITYTHANGHVYGTTSQVFIAGQRVTCGTYARVQARTRTNRPRIIPAKASPTLRRRAPGHAIGRPHGVAS